MFIAALFTVAKMWKQAKCLSMEQHIKKMQYIYTMKCYSDIKKKNNEIITFVATWVDLEIIILSEVNQRQMPYDITQMWNLKYNTNELIYETETDSQDRENRLVSAKDGGT